MAKVTLTDAKVRALKPAPAGQRAELMDVVAAGLGIRVTDRGAKSWILKGRFPGSPHPVRRTLGEYPGMSLEAARVKAGEWRQQIKAGVDPSAAERDAVAEKIANTVAAVADDFLREKVAGERKAREVERDVQTYIVKPWGTRPIVDVTDLEILGAVKKKKATAPAQARNMLVLYKRFFQWAVDQKVYKLARSPAADLKPGKIIGEKGVRDRVLTDDELFALWRAAGRIGYPAGPVYRVLALTGLRLNEAADATWDEINLTKKEWIIPAARMKGRAGKARAHLVPLTDDVLDIFQGLPKFKSRKFVFSTTNGVKPVWMSSKVKDRVDRRMLRTLRALARVRGEDPAGVTLPAWSNHDIRRSVRSQLSRLRIPAEAAEAIMAHVRPGIQKTYDHHSYAAEKREALQLWAAALRAIVNPPVAAENVVKLRKLLK